ncbi:MAG: hypothetical protein AAFR63_06840 [Cyanobacteria bacterium J06631_6]
MIICQATCSTDALRPKARNNLFNYLSTQDNSMKQEFWYILKQQDGTCKIEQLAHEQTKTPEQEQWGAYESQPEAIAKKIGLIRAGKCQPE